MIWSQNATHSALPFSARPANDTSTYETLSAEPSSGLLWIEPSRQVTTTCQNVERLSVRAPNPGLFGLAALGISATCRWVIACLIGILWGVCAGGIGFAAETQSAAPVILISVDTLRADRLSCYGFSGSRTSHIDAMAHGGTLFSEVNAQVPLTLPSHVSLLTSTYPFANGIEEQRRTARFRCCHSCHRPESARIPHGCLRRRLCSGSALRIEPGFRSLRQSFQRSRPGRTRPGRNQVYGRGGRWRRHAVDG